MVLSFAQNSKIDPAYVHHMHSTYLQTLVACGWGGLMALLLMFSYFFSALYVFYRRTQEYEIKAAILFCGIAFVTFALGITLDSYTVAGRGIIYGLVPGALLGMLGSLRDS